ncbi:hypothetical protein CFC21_085964 [Triticum aestivum]|uniref:Uncharacterized protein n=2 Tax=Triticum aestivum TaxID=4565 RepID=A0A3B6PDD3_WHEAT|nr:hypothetical protein CFC21_085964 [Triticum aestivum]
MLRLRCSILTHLLSFRATSPVSPLHRLLSAAVSPDPVSAFAVDDYLVRTCGLTPAQALKASPKLSHLKSPANPDAVLAFLAGLGLSGADVAAAVARDPHLLCAQVEKTLAPVVAGLTGLGLSPSEIAHLVSLGPHRFRRRSIVSKLEYCLTLFGSSDNLFRALKSGSVLSSDLEGVVKPNVTFLQECGLGACDIAKLYVLMPSSLSISTEHIRTAVACVEGLGVPRGSRMFKHALRAVAFLSEEEITTKIEHLKKTFRWSDAEVGIAVSKAPGVLSKSKESLERRFEFLISESWSVRRYSSRSSYALIRMLHLTSLMTMEQLAEERFQLDSVSHEPRLIRKLVCSLCHSVEKKALHCYELVLPHVVILNTSWN